MAPSYSFWILSIFTVLSTERTISAVKILGVFPVNQKSHYSQGKSLMFNLAQKGHEVTIIAPFRIENVPANLSYRQILLDNPHTKPPSLNSGRQRSMYEIMNTLRNMGEKTVINTFENSEVKGLLRGNEHFDAVIVEQFHIEGLKVLAWHYKAPLILLSAIGSNSWLNHLVGNPAPPSYVPELVSSFTTDMTFFQRIENMYIRLFWDFYNNFILLPSHDKIMRKYFPNAPKLEEIAYNTSLILLNSDISTHYAVPKVPNMIEIGGFHVQPPNQLPSDLQKFLDEAKDGVIYFCLGSRLKSSELPKSTRDMFLKAFSKLKEKVLWKWEDENLPEKPRNVEIRKWLPQQDLLAHPNLKLFITHGGLLGKIESVYHGVPLLTIPVFADQFLNAEASVSSGIGLRINFSNLTEKYFDECLHELLDNPKFRENAKKMSRIFHDRPSKPLDTSAFWVEYVIRHKGAPHLRVAALGLNWYQYSLLDVAAFGAISILLFLFFLIYLSRKIVGFLSRNVKSKTS